MGFNFRERRDIEMVWKLQNVYWLSNGKLSSIRSLWLIDYDESHLPKSNTNDDQGQNFTIIQIFWIYAPTNQNMELYGKRTL